MVYNRDSKNLSSDAPVWPEVRNIPITYSFICLTFSLSETSTVSEMTSDFFLAFSSRRFIYTITIQWRITHRISASTWARREYSSCKTKRISLSIEYHYYYNVILPLIFFHRQYHHIECSMNRYHYTILLSSVVDCLALHKVPFSSSWPLLQQSSWWELRLCASGALCRRRFAPVVT